MHSTAPDHRTSDAGRRDILARQKKPFKGVFGLGIAAEIVPVHVRSRKSPCS